MIKVLLPFAVFMMVLSSSNVFSQCEDISGDYSYLDGRGQGVVIQSGNKVTIILRWLDYSEYLFRTSRHGNKLRGDWSLIRNQGKNVTNPVFRRYEGQVNYDCSFVGVNSDDPDKRNVDGVTIIPR